MWSRLKSHAMAAVYFLQDLSTEYPNCASSSALSTARGPPGILFRALWAVGVKCDADYPVLTFSLLIAKCSRLAAWLGRKGWEGDGAPTLSGRPLYGHGRIGAQGIGCRAPAVPWQVLGELHLLAPRAAPLERWRVGLQRLCGIHRASQETWEGVRA